MPNPCFPVPFTISSELGVVHNFETHPFGVPSEHDENGIRCLSALLFLAQKRRNVTVGAHGSIGKSQEGSMGK